ncbi:MAG: methionyl-tRNA formyltransferase [Rhodospirillales bacterium]|jgi:methionyl-tRNA formyltransferase|nr:methionyl-tRNA formyltransferase [Rhodospirillales bacterium]MDP6883835.1 methionyl-tRNA formyltransferase [Rhodospirillales bacterium]
MVSLRLIFMGTPDFAVPVLDALVGAGHDVAAVYCQPPRPAGRGQRLRPSPVQARAEARGLEVRSPASLKGADEQAAFAALEADVAVIAAYGLILPKAVLEAARLGCVNVHASLLPRWRGAAPIQRAILAGDKETGVTIMRITEEVDAGPILLARPIPIGPRATAGELHDRLSALGAQLMVEALEGYAAGRLTPMPQADAAITHAAKLKPEDGRLDWRQGAEALERQVRALSPAPGAWFEYGGQRIKVRQGEVVNSKPGAAPGTLLDGRLTVACGTGALRLSKVQRPGKSAVDAMAFLRGYPITAGTRLT